MNGFLQIVTHRFFGSWTSVKGDIQNVPKKHSIYARFMFLVPLRPHEILFLLFYTPGNQT